MRHTHPYDVRIVQRTRDLVRQSLDLLAASRRAAPTPWRSPARASYPEDVSELRAQLRLLLRDRD